MEKSKTKKIVGQGSSIDLQLSRDLLQATLDTLSPHIVVLDKLGVILGVNRAWKKLAKSNNYHNTLAGVGESYFDICEQVAEVPSENTREITQGIKSVLSGKKSAFCLEYCYQEKEEKKWIMLRITRFGKDQNVFVVAHEDITEYKQTEERLYQLAAIVESTDVAIVGISLDGKIKSWNKGAERVYGFSKTEMIGKKISKYIPNDYLKEIKKIFQRIKTGEMHIESFETKRITRDGRLIDIFLTISPTKDIDGNITGVSNIGRDITKIKASEHILHELNASLEKSNRELQDFASVASHDLQEPLRKIQAFSDRLKTRYETVLPDEASDYINRMQNAAGRMQVLINDLLAFARVTTKARPFEQVDLNEIVRDVLLDLEIRIEDSGAEIIVKKLPTIEADPLQMRQLFQNLISNGLKFHKQYAKPIIKIHSENLPKTKNKKNYATCKLIIEDNGIGFDEKYLDRIFNVFQRLHSQTEYSGTGVGLAVCRKIVERHNGDISASSLPGKGSKFIVHLPITHRREINVEEFKSTILQSQKGGFQTIN